MSIINRQISIKFQNIWRNSICYIIALCCQKVKVQNWSWLSWLWFSLLSCSPWSSGQTGKTGQPGQARQERQIWHLNLTFCVRQLSQFLWCFIHGRVWIARSTLEERERLSNGSFVGTIKVKGDLDKKEAIKDLQKITSKEDPKMLEWIPNKELPHWSRWWRSQTSWRRRPRSSTSSSRRISQGWNWKVWHVTFQVAPMGRKVAKIGDPQ